MSIYIEFTEDNKAAIIAEWLKAGYRLAEEQRHTDGNYLVFVGVNDPYVPDYAVSYQDIRGEVANLKSRVSALELTTKG